MVLNLGIFRKNKSPLPAKKKTNKKSKTKKKTQKENPSSGKDENAHVTSRDRLGGGGVRSGLFRAAAAVPVSGRRAGSRAGPLRLYRLQK